MTTVISDQLTVGNTSWLPGSPFPDAASVSITGSFSNDRSPSIVGGLRTGAISGEDASTFALGGLLWNDAAGTNRTGYAAYLEAYKSGGSTTHGIEVGVMNTISGSPPSVTPQSMRPTGASLAYWASAGKPSSTTMYNVSCVLGVVDNTSTAGACRFDRGLVFGSQSLNAAIAEAVTMDEFHNLQWYDGGGKCAAINSKRSEFLVRSDSVPFEMNLYRAHVTNGPKTQNDDVLGAINFFQLNASGGGEKRAFILSQKRTDNRTSAEIWSTNDGVTFVGVALNEANNAFAPRVDNQLDCGASARRWSNIYAANGTIVTSDARTKRLRGAINDRERAAIQDVEIVCFQQRDSIAEKGDEHARLHFGVVAQQVVAAFADHGLDAFRYGLVGQDPWMETVHQVEEYLVEEMEEIEVAEEVMAMANGRMTCSTIVTIKHVPIMEELLVHDETGAVVMLPPTVHLPERPRTVSVPKMRACERLKAVERQRIDPLTGEPMTKLNVRYSELSMMMEAARRDAIFDWRNYEVSEKAAIA